VSSPLQINPGVEASAVGFDLAGKRVFVAGHTGMAGSAIVRRLRQEPCNVLVAERSELDLTRQDQARTLSVRDQARRRDHGGRSRRWHIGQ
jgi:nucleoside-diphosphate-sugar epimerase